MNQSCDETGCLLSRWHEVAYLLLQSQLVALESPTAPALFATRSRQVCWSSTYRTGVSQFNTTYLSSRILPKKLYAMDSSRTPNECYSGLRAPPPKAAE
jgi:hypothetical protein